MRIAWSEIIPPSSIELFLENRHVNKSQVVMRLPLIIRVIVKSSA